MTHLTTFSRTTVEISRPYCPQHQRATVPAQGQCNHGNPVVLGAIQKKSVTGNIGGAELFGNGCYLTSHRFTFCPKP